MSDSYFLDTNIIVYSFDQESPTRRQIAQELIERALTDGVGCISYQVVQETLNVMTGKFKVRLSLDDSRLFLREVLTPLQVVYPSEHLYQSAINVAERWRYSFYDALIIAGALEAGCHILYSEDLQHNQQIESLTILNPFAETRG